MKNDKYLQSNWELKFTILVSISMSMLFFMRRRICPKIGVQMKASELRLSRWPRISSISAIAGTGVLAAFSYIFRRVSLRESSVKRFVWMAYSVLKWFLIEMNVTRSLSAETKRENKDR